MIGGGGRERMGGVGGMLSFCFDSFPFLHAFLCFEAFENIAVVGRLEEPRHYLGLTVCLTSSQGGGGKVS